MMHWNEAFVVALISISAVLLLATATAWRRTVGQNPGLPIWRFLRREGISLFDEFGLRVDQTRA